MSTGLPDKAPRLVADIGGTNARFALVPSHTDIPTEIRTLPCADFSDFAAAATAYLDMVGASTPSEGLCAIANPVTGDYLKMTNHAWAFSIEESRQRLGFQRLRFVNDWAAQSLAIPHLRNESFRKIGGGSPSHGHPMAVLGPGTGLGVSGLVPSADGWVPIEGEGGHVTFSPATDREAAVAGIARRKFGHCSAERIASGIGLVANYEALCELDGVAVAPLEPSDITERAKGGQHPQCREAVELFCMGLATTASNLAVTLGALGGVYIGGGIIPRLGTLFDPAAFRARFEDKGRFHDYLAAIPTYLVEEDNPALLGLAKKLGPVHDG